MERSGWFQRCLKGGLDLFCELMGCGEIDRGVKSDVQLWGLSTGMDNR